MVVNQLVHVWFVCVCINQSYSSNNAPLHWCYSSTNHHLHIRICPRLHHIARYSTNVFRIIHESLQCPLIDLCAPGVYEHTFANNLMLTSVVATISSISSLATVDGSSPISHPLIIENLGVFSTRWYLILFQQDTNIMYLLTFTCTLG